MRRKSYPHDHLGREVRSVADAYDAVEGEAVRRDARLRKRKRRRPGDNDPEQYRIDGFAAAPRADRAPRGRARGGRLGKPGDGATPPAGHRWSDYFSETA